MTVRGIGLTFDAVYMNSYEEPKAGGHSLLAVRERVAGFAGDDPAAMYLHTLLVMFSSDLTFDVMTQISSTQDLPEIIFCSAREELHCIWASSATSLSNLRTPPS